MPNQNLEFVPGTIEGRTLLLSDIMRVFKRYAWIAAILGPGLGMTTYFWAKNQPKLYDAVATIQLDQHETLTLPGQIGSSDEYELKTNTQIAVIQSRDVAFKVIKDLNLQNDRRFNPSYPSNTDLSDPVTKNFLVGIFHGGLNVSRVGKTELINITFRGPSPMLDMEIANKTVDTYLQQNFQNHYLGSKEIAGWLKSTLDGLKDQIQKEQGDLLALEMKLGIYIIGPTTTGGGGGVSSAASTGTPSSIFQDEMTTLEAQYLEAEKERILAEATYQILKNDKTDTLLPETMPGTLMFNNLEVQLSTLISQEAQMSSRYGPNYIQLVALQKEEVELRKLIAEERVRAIQSTEQQVKISDKTIERIKEKIEESKANAKLMNPDSVRYEVLKAQYGTDQGLYNGLLQLISAGGIENGLKAQNVNHMAAADIPTSPSWPKVFVYTFAGFAMGLTIAVIIITVIIMISDTVETVEQIEETLRLPVLTAVPLYKLDPADPSSTQAVLATLLIPRSAAAESYRILRTAVNLMPIRGRGRVIGVTSCGPAEGKSTTVMNLAVACSQQNKRVLLIDGDLRKPALAQRLKLPSATTPGLSRYLSDPQVSPEDCIQPIQSLPGLSVLPVQDIPPFPSELLAQGRLGDLLAWARENFDIVLIDTPPVLLVADSLIIAEWLDIVLIVARVRVAQRRALRRVREEFSRFPEKHVGIVVNAVPQSQSYYGGYSGYHGYYGSGTSY